MASFGSQADLDALYILQDRYSGAAIGRYADRHYDVNMDMETYDSYEGAGRAPDGVMVSTSLRPGWSRVSRATVVVERLLEFFASSPIRPTRRAARGDGVRRFQAFCFADEDLVSGNITETIPQQLPDVPDALPSSVRIMLTDGFRKWSIYLDRVPSRVMMQRFARRQLELQEEAIAHAAHAARAPMEAVETVRRCHVDRIYMDGDAVPEFIRDGGENNVSFLAAPADEMATCYRRSELLKFWSKSTMEEYVGIYHGRKRSNKPEMMVFKMPYEGVWVLNAYRVLRHQRSRLFLLKPVGTAGIGTARFGVSTLHGEPHRIYVMVPEIPETERDVASMERIRLPNWDVTWRYEERDEIFEQSDDGSDDDLEM